MRIRKLGFLSLGLAAGALLFGGTALAQNLSAQARLDGCFGTKDAGQTTDGENEACVSFDDDDDIEVDGEVQGVSGGCTAFISYDTDSFNKASGKKLPPGKTAGTVKLQQQIFSDISVGLFDTDGGGPGVCAEAFSGDAEPEKCSVKASLKGTKVPDTPTQNDDDTVDSAKVSVKCDLGDALAEVDTDLGMAGTQPPSAAEVSALVAAFSGRKDVKIDDRGKLTIKHSGVEEPAAETPRCGPEPAVGC